MKYTKTIISLILGIFLIASISAISTTNVTDGLTAWWSFEGNANDNLGRVNGTEINDSYQDFYGLGIKGEGLTLGGIDNNYILINSNSLIHLNDTNFTISFWVNLNTKDNFSIIDEAPSAGIGRWTIKQFNTKIYFIGDLAPAPTNLIKINNSLGIWQHIIIGRNGTDIFSCLNNDSCNYENQFASSDSFSALSNLVFGCDQFSFNACLNGTLDEVMIYNRSLNQTEIDTIYYEQSDNIYPNFTNFTDTNGTTDLDGNFSVNVNNTNGTVILIIDNQNISATNDSDTHYLALHHFSSSGTYDYYWASYGNGLNNNYGSSETKNYTIVLANSCSQYEILGYKLIRLGLSLAVLSVAWLFFWYKRDDLEPLTLGGTILGTIAIIIAINLAVPAFNAIGGC